MTNEMSTAPMWDQRYSTDAYVFGTEPAQFVAGHADALAPGSRVLVVADGEGRNSVFLAGLGHDVVATDISEVGLDKARRLAAERGVTVDLRLTDVTTWDWEPAAYDAVVAVFIQFLDPEQRAIVFDGMQRTLRPRGRLLLHGYRVEQIAYGTGGPPIAAHLYDEALLATAFADLEIDELRSYDLALEEGAGHAGMSALVDLVATRP